MAPEIHAEFKGVISIVPNPARKMLELRLMGIDGRSYVLDLPAGILSGLIVGLMSQMRVLGTTAADQHASIQPMHLTTGRLFRLGDGTPGMELTLEHSLQLPLIFQKEAIPALRSALDMLEREMKTQPPTPKPN